jgi:hypothetical protein
MIEQSDKRRNWAGKKWNAKANINEWEEAR